MLAHLKIVLVDIRVTLIFCSSLSSCWSSGPRGWAEALDRGQGSQSSAGIQPDCQQPKTGNSGGRKLFSGENLKFYAPCLNLGWRGLIKTGKVWNCWKHSKCIVLFGSCLFWSRLNMFLWDRDLASADISILTTRSTLHTWNFLQSHHNGVAYNGL